MRTRWSALTLMASFTLAACGGARSDPARPEPTARVAAGDGFVTSNILRSDYVGSPSCEPCHSEIYRAWSGSPMHRMTREATTAEVRAPFDGRVFRFKNDAAKLVQDGSDRFMIVSSPLGDHTYRVTRIIGGRHREDFAGVEVADARRGAPALGDSSAELVLPVTYVFSPPSFRVKGYSVMVGERPGLKAGGIWNQTCIFCHNTAPYFSSLFGELLGRSAPAYQGEVVDRLLPPARRSPLAITDGAALSAAARSEMIFLARGHGENDSATGAAEVGRWLENARRATQNGFTAADLIEVGIGCESCHGGSRAHAASPTVKPSFEVRSTFLRASPSPWDQDHRAADRARAENRTCARCHQVLFSRYPYTWEGGKRNGDAGGSHVNSGEARDFLLGGCTSALTCVACHDPHALDAAEKLGALETPAGNEACVRCHAEKRGDDPLLAHTHHRPGSAGAVCINCHMPRKNMGLAYNLTRYHRIGSPTDRARVEEDRPLECALCHADKTVEELVSTMERWWQKHYDRARLAALYGDIDAMPLPRTVERGKGHEQATALYILGEKRVTSATTLVAAQMLNRYPLVRYYARQSLTALTGRDCDVNLDQDDARIQIDVTRWLAESDRSTRRPER